MKWILLLSSVLCEVTGTTALKLASQGGRYAFSWGIAVVVLYTACFALLGVTLRHFELGMLYAIWSGIGVCLLALIGVMFFGDSLNTMKVASIALIVVGIIGLNLSGLSH
jgi:multidrug transporter EmrE-like cation transporter